MKPKYTTIIATVSDSAMRQRAAVTASSVAGGDPGADVTGTWGSRLCAWLGETDVKETSPTVQKAR